MIEQVLMWCGLMILIGVSCFICGVGIQFISEQHDMFWGRLAQKAKANTKAWMLFKRVQRRYVK